MKKFWVQKLIIFFITLTFTVFVFFIATFYLPESFIYESNKIIFAIGLFIFALIIANLFGEMPNFIFTKRPYKSIEGVSNKMLNTINNFKINQSDDGSYYTSNSTDYYYGKKGIDKNHIALNSKEHISLYADKFKIYDDRIEFLPGNEKIYLSQIDSIKSFQSGIILFVNFIFNNSNHYMFLSNTIEYNFGKVPIWKKDLEYERNRYLSYDVADFINYLKNNGK